MANTILDRYGIKEVADVTFYELDKDGNPGAPVLYLDTLKVSTIEQTAENTTANGGKGNPPLIMWDYGKDINVTLEDALFSPKSMAIMFGDVDIDGKITATEETSGTIMKTVPVALYNGTQMQVNNKWYTVDNATLYDAAGATVTSAKDAVYVTGTLTTKEITTIEITPNTFPGTYYVTGDTYARSENNGRDEFFQFQIAKAKVQSENTITLEAEGDPSVFNMSLKVLRPKTGPMMQLVKYNLVD